MVIRSKYKLTIRSKLGVLAHEDKLPKCFHISNLGGGESFSEMGIKRMRFKVITFIMMESIIIIIVMYLYLSTNTEHQSANTYKPTRDYVLNQEETENKPGDNVLPPEPPMRVRHIQIYKQITEELEIKDHKCVDLKTLYGSTPICVYPRKVDSMISAYVTDFHTWEEDWLNFTAEVLLKHRDFVYLDLGCNIGVYTLFVAKLGTVVYAVDPNINNLKLLTNSLRLGNIHENVTLILNAISDKHGNVTLEIINGNIGGSVIKEIDETNSKHSNGNVVEAITLDDIAEILKNKKAFIKMDIESYELNAILGAHNFFQTVDVRYIQMEWTHFRYNEKGHIITDSLIKHGLFPYLDIHSKIPLHPDKYYAWPENIVWIKR